MISFVTGVASAPSPPLQLRYVVDAVPMFSAQRAWHSASGITGGSMTLSWAPPLDDGGSLVATYIVMQAKGPGLVSAAEAYRGPRTTFTVYGLLASTYIYR